MGVDTKRLTPASNRSVSAYKQSKSIGTTTGVVHSQIPIAGTGEAKIATSPSYEDCSQHSSRSSMTVDRQTVLSNGGKGNGKPKIFPTSLPSSPRKRQPDLRSVASNEGIPKSARTNNTFRNDATKSGSPAPSRNLSFGNIYKPSPDRLQQNSRSAEPSPSNKHVLGHAQHNYGYGNIIKGVKKVDNMKSNCKGNGDKKIVEKQNCLVSKTVSRIENIEELKKAGNEKYKKGCFVEAISFYNTAIEFCPQNAACHYNKAAALAGLGKVTEAVGECLEAIKQNRSYSRAHYKLGTLYTRLGQVYDARRHFKLSGQNISEVLKRLLRLEVHITNIKKAQKLEDWDCVLRESILCMEAGANASNQLIAVKAEALLKLHRVKEALGLLRAAKVSEESKSKKACKGTSCLLIVETQANLYLGRFSKGIGTAQQAVNADSNANSLTWLRKAKGVADARKDGNVLYKDGKYLEACTIFSRGLQYVPTNSVLLCHRAACRSKLGQWEMAIDDCNVALEHRPGYSKALSRRAHSNARLKRWEESLKDYTLLRNEMPTDQAIVDSLLQLQKELKKSQGMLISCHKLIT